MKTDKGNFCDMPRITGGRVPGCKAVAASELFCQVEGRAILFCGPCGRAWRNLVINNPKLQGRCPNCSKHEPAPTVVPINPHPSRPVTDIFREAIDHAMKQEGILEPVRNKVMARLAHEAPWMCQEDVAAS
jgi:hypothetical protein